MDEPSAGNGHGTHCAGTALGSTYGVARAATLHGVRVLNCGGSGTWAGVIAGMNWVAVNHVVPAVASMSLGGGFSQAINDAVATMHDAGVVVTTAAGNSNADACSSSPASAPKSFTVASMTSSDARSSFSNYGACTNMFAPGSSIKSAWIGGNTTTNTISGTSMAAPHVAGVMAVYLGTSTNLTSPPTPDDVWQALTTVAAVDKISNAQSGTPNLLLQAVGFCDRDSVDGPHEDCVLSDWSDWSACSASPVNCEGTRTSNRTVLSPASGCGTCTTLLQQSETCFDSSPGCANPEPAELFVGGRSPAAMTAVTLAPNATRDPTAMDVVCREDILPGGFPIVDPAGHSVLNLGDDSWEAVEFPAGRHFTFFGVVYQRMYVGSNGYVTFGQGHTSYSASQAQFFLVSDFCTIIQVTKKNDKDVTACVKVKYDDVGKTGNCDIRLARLVGSIDLSRLTKSLRNVLSDPRSGC